MRFFTAQRFEEANCLRSGRSPKAGHPVYTKREADFPDQLAEISPKDVIALALRLIKRSELHYRFFAYEVVQFHKQALRSLTEKLWES